MREGKRLRYRREKLWRENGGKCHWCGCDTVLPPLKDRRSKDEYPDNEATIDHLYSRFHPKRQKPNYTNEIRTVLCCRKCNWKRSRAEELQLGIDGLNEHKKKMEEYKKEMQ